MEFKKGHGRAHETHLSKWSLDFGRIIKKSFWKEFSVLSLCVSLLVKPHVELISLQEFGTVMYPFQISRVRCQLPWLDDAMFIVIMSWFLELLPIGINHGLICAVVPHSIGSIGKFPKRDKKENLLCFLREICFHEDPDSYCLYDPCGGSPYRSWAGTPLW